MLPVTPLRQFGVGGTTKLISFFGVPSSASIIAPCGADAAASRIFGAASSHRRGFHATPAVNGARVRRRPLMESFDRRLLRAMTEPVYPREVLYPVRINALTPYQEYRADWLEHIKSKVHGALERNEVFGFFFCTQPEDRREFNRLQQTFRQAGLMLNDWKAEDILAVLEGTKYENMGTILNENVLFCHPYEHFQEGMPKDYVPPPKIDNATAIKEMLRLGRTMPLLTLLGGLIENELVTRTRMVEYTELGTIDSQRGQLCALLSSVPSTTSSLLTHHQNVLGATLAAYVTENSSSDVSSDS